MIPTEKQYEFAQLVKYATYRKSKAWDDLVDYIQQPNVSMPSAHIDFNDGLVCIYDLFSLPQSPQFWSAFEEKLILFLQQSIWSQVDYRNLNFPNLPRYFIGHYLARHRTYFHDSMYEFWINTLTKYEIPESEIWLGISGDYNAYNSEFACDYLLNNAEEHLSSLRFNFGQSSFFIDFLFKNQPLLIDKYLDKVMVYENSLNGEKSIPKLTKQMKQYLMINPENNENNLVGFLSYKMNYEVVFELTDLIKKNYLDKYKNEIKLCLDNYINLIINDLYQINSTVFIDFLDYLLATNSPEIAFKISAKYLNKFKNPNAESVKIWLKKLKIYESAI